MSLSQRSDQLTRPRVAVIQDGARLHYAIPIALQRVDALVAMFTEVFFRNNWRTVLLRAIVQRIPLRGVRSLLQRRADEIHGQFVRTNFPLAARQRLAKRQHCSDEAFYQSNSRANADWVMNKRIGNANALFGFIRNIDPRLCRHYRANGILTAADQIIAPAVVEEAESDLQQQRWPDWSMPQRKVDHHLVQQVEAATWAELDLITCGSQYVCDGLLAQGIPRQRIEVLPYPIDAAKYQVRPAPHKVKTLTVGFLGSVGLRKGAPYFLEVAARLRNAHIHFVMVGPVHLPTPITKLLAESVELTGAVPRASTIDWLHKFDMLLFPSTCEGNAGAVTEAMACGLPIIASPNSGTPVRDGIEGFIRNYDDIDGMIACVEKLAADTTLRRDMGIASRKNAESLTLDQYGQRLVNRLTQLLITRHGS